jgi:hypothetical protein
MNKAWLIDAAERIASTFLEAFLAIVVAAGVDTINVSTLRAALVAGLTAVLSFLKTLAASRVGKPTSASLVPSVGPPPA